MQMHALSELHAADLVSPLVVGVLYVFVCSLLKEPNRQNFMAIMIAGAGAAYLNGGLGIWEFAFTAAITFCAYKGLHSYRYIGVGWLLHSGWDLMQQFHGSPIVPFIPTSSLGCAICDPVIAVWCFAGAPSAFDLLRRRKIHLT